MVAREGVEPPTTSLFRLALISICNDLTGLRWLRKSFKVRERRACLGLGSWAGSIGWWSGKATDDQRSLGYEPFKLSL